MRYDNKALSSQVFQKCLKIFVLIVAFSHSSSCHPNLEAKNLGLGTVKAVFTYTAENKTYILMSLKKSKKSKKNQRFEFLGGKIDLEDDHEFKALLRELSEEETTQTLSEFMRQGSTKSPSHELRYKKKPLYLYHIHLNNTIHPFNASSFKFIENEKESYSLQWILLKDLITDTDLLLTKQTRFILSEYQTSLLTFL
ncbi:MAG: hypothetical protein AB8C84_07515 [Oligoflexales bacterium]